MTPADRDRHEHDRHEHGGYGRLDDDELARRTEQERVDAGIDAYDPENVPPATDAPPAYDPELDEQLQEERGMARRQQSEGEIHPITEETPFPPTHYDE
jgi:hypothetical protein